MKKRIIVLLSLLLLISLVGCSKKTDTKDKLQQDPMTIYKEAVDKMSKIDAMDTAMTVTMSLTQGDQTTDMTMDMTAKMKNRNSKDMKYLSNMKASILGKDVEMNLMFDKETYYADMLGQKIKCKLDYQKMLDQVNKSAIQPNDMSQFIEDAEVKKVGDNNVISYKIAGDKMTQFIQYMMKNLGTNLNDTELSYAEIEGSGETTIDKDGYFSSVKMNISFNVEANSQTMKIDMVTDMTYNQIGDKVEDFEIPDTSGYTEVDPSSLNLQ